MSINRSLELEGVLSSSGVGRVCDTAISESATGLALPEVSCIS